MAVFLERNGRFWRALQTPAICVDGTHWTAMDAVGMPVTQHPPHRSRRAVLPHRALASGRDAQALRRIRMQDMGYGQPALRQGVHARPCHPVPLTAAAERLTPVAHDRLAKHFEQTAIAGHSIVPIVPQEHALQPGALLRDRPVHAPPQRIFDGLQLLTEPLHHRFAPDRKLPLPRGTAYMRKPEKVEGRRFALSPPPTSVRREAPKLDEPRLLRMQLQIELPHTFPQFSPEPFGVVPVFEAHDEIVAVPHDDHISACVLSPPAVGP